MYLNVNLTPPPQGTAEGSCTTPKTPEILNSLINLTSPPLPHSYAHYQTQVEGSAMVSPMSEVASPLEETAVAAVGRLEPATPRHHGAAFPPSCGGPDSSTSVSAGGKGRGGGRGGFVGGSPGTSGMGGPLAGSSPPSTPDLPSPVSTVEATKSALIKEGLKLQIRCKLQAAGMDNEALLDDKCIKFEEDDALTEEDEERRKRRRERNKIAATKCRNKKKEKTYVLMNESESVEDMNVRLKTEIQRLNAEKNKLEKILRDPDHRASCRHSPRCSKTQSSSSSSACSVTPRPPLLIVTPAESPDALSSSSSSSSSSSCSDSPTSPPSSLYKFPSSSIPTSSVSPPGVSVPSSSPTTSTSTSSTSSSSSSSQFLAPKYSPSQSHTPRHHPYQYPHARAHQHSVTPDNKLFPCPPSPSSSPAAGKGGFGYQCLTPTTRQHEFTPPTPPTHRSVYKGRGGAGGIMRYTPYRSLPGPSPLATHAHPQPVTVCGETYNQSSLHNNNNNNSGCGREDQSSYLDPHTNQFFPPCSYSSM